MKVKRMTKRRAERLARAWGIYDKLYGGCGANYPFGCWAWRNGYSQDQAQEMAGGYCGDLKYGWPDERSDLNWQHRIADEIDAKLKKRHPKVVRKIVNACDENAPKECYFTFVGGNGETLQVGEGHPYRNRNRDFETLKKNMIAWVEAGCPLEVNEDEES